MADEKNEVKIKLNAADEGAFATLRRLVASLATVKSSVGNFIKAFSKIGWIVSSYQALVGIFQKVQEWTSRAATAARELADQLERKSNATAAA